METPQTDKKKGSNRPAAMLGLCQINRPHPDELCHSSVPFHPRFFMSYLDHLESQAHVGLGVLWING